MTKPNIKYKLIKPSVYLNDFIKYYWHFKIKLTEAMPFDILPDGYFDLLIMFKNDQIIDVQLTGIWNKLITVYYDENVEIFGIRFKPIALESIFNLHINELINNSANLELKDYKLNSQQIIDEFNHSGLNIVNYFNNIFLKMLESVQINKRIKGIFELIENSAGTKQIENISNSIGISTRQIHRISKDLLGMSAKDYSQIVRFRENLNSTKIDKNNYFGYFDQSHFIKEFKKFTGTTPQNLDICADVRFLQYFDFINH